MGKGDWVRPVKDRKSFDDNWERIFGSVHSKKRAESKSSSDAQRRERAAEESTNAQ